MAKPQYKHRLQDIYKFILRFKMANDGNSPTIREICNACGISSTSVASGCLQKLAEQGKIFIEGEARTRMIKVVGAQWHPPGMAR